MSSNPVISLTLNGEMRSFTLPPETPLLYVLRNDCGLKGPKYGCGAEQCGACKVLVDGAAVPSCKLPLEQVDGLEVITIEGLGDAGNLHPLQACFVEEQAIQCGYCASGMLMAAQGLLNRTRYPSDDEIRAALADNICRCGVYERIRRAIKLRIGRPDRAPIYTLPETEPLAPPPSPTATLPVSLQETPDLDAWIHIAADGYIDISTGKVEIGQGIKTAVVQIAADELDVAPARIRVVTVDTDSSPDEGVTAGSMSLQMTGSAIRQAAAEVRAILLELAHEELESACPPASLTVEDGTIRDPQSGQKTTYWRLFGGQRFGRPANGMAVPKPAAERRIVGRPMKRIDLTAKVTGTPAYVQDLDLPELVYGRMVRPPSYDARLEAVKVENVLAMAGVVTVVRDGSFLGVIAQREEQAVAAAAALAGRARWSTGTPLPQQAELYTDLQSRPAAAYPVEDGIAVEAPVVPLAQADDAAARVTASYLRPFQMHGSLGPSAAVARWDGDQVTVWSHTQGPYVLKRAIAATLELEEASVRIIHAEGSGCYGHNGADDAAFDAALLARAVPGRPVALQWSRADEHMWEPYGPAMVGTLQADLDNHGQIRAWNHDIWSYPHLARPRPVSGTSGLLAAWHLEEPVPAPPPRLAVGARHVGAFRNADPIYALPQRRIVTHFPGAGPLRSSAMRSLGAYANIFAIESFMDELAAAAGIDPVQFRLRHLEDERAIAVLTAAADRIGWRARTSPAADGSGQGIALAQYKNIQTYAAIAVELEVEDASGEIQLTRAVIAADAGEIVNPDGLSNQLEGGFVQAASWTLCEEVAYDSTGILSRDWDTYPVLRAPGIPPIETILLNRPEMPFLGAGEATQNPTPAAIANAVYDAMGVRLRQIPFTPERVLAALAERAA